MDVSIYYARRYDLVVKIDRLFQLDDPEFYDKPLYYAIIHDDVAGKDLGFGNLRPLYKHKS